MRVLTDPWVATSSGVPLRSHPPSPAYVPSVFSLTTTKSHPGARSPRRAEKRAEVHVEIELEAQPEEQAPFEQPGGDLVEPTGGPTAPRTIAS